MHEIGIANSILEAGEAEAARYPGSRLKRVGVRIGVLAGVDLEALEFALAVLRKGAGREQVEIELKSCPRRNRCMSCCHEFETALYSEPCPRCAEPRSEIVGGQELELSFVELEDQ